MAAYIGTVDIQEKLNTYDQEGRAPTSEDPATPHHSSSANYCSYVFTLAVNPASS